MTYKPGLHIYFAAPFFNEVQRNLCDFVEELGSEIYPIYSPRIDGGVLRPDSNNEQRAKVFDSNKVAIEVADWVLAVVDDFDSGVIWEMGYAHGMGTSILGYSDVEGRGLNVMLAGSCNLGFINGREGLTKLFASHKASTLQPDFPYNTWSGEIQ